jgi:hypothetical protein
VPGDFYIAPSEHAPGVIHAVIGSPGLTAALAIAEMMINLLSDSGMVMEEKRDFQEGREAIIIMNSSTTGSMKSGSLM